MSVFPAAPRQPMHPAHYKVTLPLGEVEERTVTFTAEEAALLDKVATVDRKALLEKVASYTEPYLRNPPPTDPNADRFKEFRFEQLFPQRELASYLLNRVKLSDEAAEAVKKKEDKPTFLLRTESTEEMVQLLRQMRNDHNKVLKARSWLRTVAIVISIASAALVFFTWYISIPLLVLGVCLGLASSHFSQRAIHIRTQSSRIQEELAKRDAIAEQISKKALEFAESPIISHKKICSQASIIQNLDLEISPLQLAHLRFIKECNPNFRNDKKIQKAEEEDQPPPLEPATVDAAENVPVVTDNETVE